jgi:hypothetical protein
MRRLTCTSQGSPFHPFPWRRLRVISPWSPMASRSSSHSRGGLVSEWLPSFSGSREWLPYTWPLWWADFPQPESRRSRTPLQHIEKHGSVYKAYFLRRLPSSSRMSFVSVRSPLFMSLRIFVSSICSLMTIASSSFTSSIVAARMSMTIRSSHRNTVW